ncbi:type IV pilus biogenesis protein PilP [Pectobacterium carotovorum]|uniref:type IV pilus biogenesis protein PilP n=1 Tax=Pectobacterium carotovorum TaxID=554 RepID=UPI0029DD02B4|nr:type IV pilus biogenesis protein PilP [Pectobacterium carotovorum]MDX6917804.1 type IV pilus biogenesis protein PilP [Pectobacterium carotovorum]
MRLAKYITALFIQSISFYAGAAEGETGKIVSTPSATPVHNLTTKDLERIQAETVLYEARAARAKAIISWQTNGNGLDAPVPIMGVTTSAEKATEHARIDRFESVPRILEIAGSSGQLTCRMLMPDGTVVEARNGQRLPGSAYTVDKITSQGVQLKTDAGKIVSPSFTE